MITKQQLSDQIAQELTIGNHQVAAVLDLFDENATVPFIARYRKERTGGLDEVQIRAIEERRDYLNELSQRRDTILAAIEEQGKLTPATVVDHIIPHRGDKKLFWDERNWQALCESCHNHKTGSGL